MSVRASSSFANRTFAPFARAWKSAPIGPAATTATSGATHRLERRPGRFGGVVPKERVARDEQGPGGERRRDVGGAQPRARPPVGRDRPLIALPRLDEGPRGQFLVDGEDRFDPGRLQLGPDRAGRGIRADTTDDRRARPVSRPPPAPR